MRGIFWAIEAPTAIMTGDDLYDFLIVPVSTNVMERGVHRDELRFLVDDQVVSLPIVLNVTSRVGLGVRPPSPKTNSRRGTHTTLASKRRIKVPRILAILVFNLLIPLVLVFGIPFLLLHTFSHWQSAFFDFFNHGSAIRKTVWGAVAGFVVMPTTLISSSALTLVSFFTEDWLPRISGYIGAVIFGFFWGTDLVEWIIAGHAVNW